MSRQCPICKTKLKHEDNTEEVWGSHVMSEEYETCNHCKLYNYEFAYGAHKIELHKKTFIWDYKTKISWKYKFYLKLIKTLYKFRLIKATCYNEEE